MKLAFDIFNCIILQAVFFLHKLHSTLGIILQVIFTKIKVQFLGQVQNIHILGR